jgi:predicted FMN-binding regulatory protein PaiB
MTREEFTVRVNAIGRCVGDQNVVVIVFNDGERHLSPCWSIKEKDDEFVVYSDVHARYGSASIEVPYRLIADVIDYHQKEQ